MEYLIFWEIVCMIFFNLYQNLDGDYPQFAKKEREIIGDNEREKSKKKLRLLKKLTTFALCSVVGRANNTQKSF
jgi:hypothetical protein